MKKLASKNFRISNVQFIVLMFLMIIFIGSVLLWLPFTHQEGQTLPYIDALFVATSAVCVTGLTPINISEVLNPIGHTVMMLLIELGGLGFMSVALILALMFKKRVSFQSRLLIKDTLNLDQLGGSVKLLKFVVRLSLSIQLIGALLLSTQFIPEYGLKKGVFFSIFHSISAFCNAGFDLFGDSLMSFQGNEFVLVVIALLILSGGFGFIVWYDLIHYRSQKRLSLHTKIALVVSLCLVAGGTLIFLITDANRGSSVGNQLANSFFLSVTPRTAGFASLDYATMSYAGILLTIVLMFIGGTSGSTAGGIKTTTLGVLLIQLISLLRGREDAEGFGRKIPMQTVMKAFMFVFFSTAICFVSALVLSMTESIPYQSGIEYVLFEVVSAFATVGLTMGLTPDLTVFGKLLIMSLMFVGRVGLYTVVFALLRKNAKKQKFNYVSENVLVG
ncbi:Trk family potassium uptake protein [Vagococcus sp. DIV0080]|uniref:Trk family potassium uptake protein n=1 Tax=Candidatus Vagococcus giribetii TaxID=2230876 RepID=A0ABS3HVF6_9ENTE|nr:TrkH family potassium uptake protein [Vagococcus sp. DIV0080]MBO0477709.1 Trk family potassium uptake protein [Vagococcus sp. DIV0080]